MFTVPECRSFIVGITAGLLGLVGNVPTASAATCLGAPVDGVIFDATIYSYAAGNYYYERVVFNGGDAIILFGNGVSGA